MKQLPVLILILVCTHTFAQDSLTSFNYYRNHTLITGMKVLGSWGAANVGIGTVGWAGSNSRQNKYFYQMSTFWGAVNFGVALLGFTNAKKNVKKQFSTVESLKAQQKTERIFLINAGIDAIYTGTGIILNNSGNNSNNPQLKGYGSSVIIQGIFLMLFDATMYKFQKANGNKLRHFLEKNPVISASQL